MVCLEKRIVIEVGGGQHSENVHRDGLRTKDLESHGYKVLRFWNNEVMTNTNGIVEKIIKECE